jgi:hypothetical protein
MTRFVLNNTLVKVYIHHYLINIYNKKRSKLHFGSRVAVLNTRFFIKGETMDKIVTICIGRDP